MSSLSEVNHKTWPKGMPRRGAKYLRYLLRKNWYIALLWIFYFLIPAYHVLMCEIPSQENLQLAQGTLFFESRARAGIIVVLSGTNGNEYYTCRSTTFASNHDCISPLKGIETLTGKEAKIWWFEQNIFLGYSQRRLVRLIVDDHEEYSIQKAVMQNERTKNSFVFFSIVMLVFFVFIVVLFEREDIRKSKEKPTHG